jgi:hypothetical protein
MPNDAPISLDGASSTGPAQPGIPQPATGGNALAQNASLGKHGNGSAVKDCTCAPCEAERQKWRDKRKRKKAPGAPDPVAVIPRAAAPFVASPQSFIPAPDGALPPIPWVKGDLMEVSGDLIGFADAALTESCKRDAAQISPAALELVAQKAPLSPELRTRLQSSLAGCSAKWMTKTGVSAEYKDEVILLGGLALWGRNIHGLKTELRDLIKEKLESEKKEKKNVGTN